MEELEKSVLEEQQDNELISDFFMCKSSRYVFLL